MKALFTAVPFIYYIMSTFQEKMTRHNKKKKKKQKNTAWTDWTVSEPKSGIVAILELSDQEFQNTD